jgi:cell division protein FtsW (lipid II flippase)
MIEARPVTRGPAGAQLALTIFAIVLAVAAFALVELGLRRSVTQHLAEYGALIVVGYVIAHLLVRRLAPNADPALFPVAGLLAGVGFAVIYRLDPGRSAEQASWLVVGLIAFALTLWLVKDHRKLDAYTYTIGLLGVIFLLLPIVPGLGREVNGARVWITFGGKLTFQPAEMGKVLIAIFLASYLGRKRELLQVAPGRLGPFQLPQAKHLGPVLLAWGVALAVLFFEKDLGTSLLYFGIFVVMLWVATARGSYLAIGVVLFAIGALFAYATFGHVKDRVGAWEHALDSSPCPGSSGRVPCVEGQGFQIAQSQFAFATGGIGGTGLGLGNPDQIPFASTDMIYAAVGEELGLLGSVGVLLLFLALVGKGLKTAVQTGDTFGKLLAAGLSAILGLQAFIIMGGVTRLIPLTGVTLPFMSYGGSSLVANFVLLALLIRISSGPAPRRRDRRTVVS